MDLKISKIILILCIVLPMHLYASDEEESGFLEDYSKLKADEARPGAKVYEAPGMNLSKYDRILLEPVILAYHPNSKYKGIDPDQLKAITDSLAVILKEELESDYPFVSTPGPTTLQVRLAITNIYAKKKKKGLFSYTPIGLVTSGVKSISGKSTNVTLKHAVFEGEIYDSVSGDRLAAVTDRLTEPYKGQDNVDSMTWGDIRDILRVYAKRFHERLKSVANKQ